MLVIIFAVGESAHDALNNILAVQGYTGMFDQDGTEDSSLNSSCVYQFRDGVPASGDPDSESYAYSKATGERVTNRLRNRISITGRRIPELRSLISAVLTGQRLSPPKPVSVPVAGEEMQTKLQGEVYQKAEDAPSAAEMHQGEADMDIPLP